MINFDYMYRDASNYKAFGTVKLSGNISNQDREILLSYLEGGEFFVAEQVGVPCLKHIVSGDTGENVDDHGWHSFVSINPADGQDCDPVWGTSTKLISAFRRCADNWNPSAPDF